MLRRRLLPFLILVTALGALLYVLVSLYLPSPRRLIFGVDKQTGAVRKAQQGLAFLPPHQFYRMTFERRGDAAQRDGSVRIVTREGVPITLFYRLRFNVEESRLPDARRLVRDGWSAWIRARVGEAVAAVAPQFPVEEISSPGSEMARRRELLRTVVSRHLGRSGLDVRAFEILRVEVDRQALLEYKRAELRRNAHGAYGRVAVIAIDGADWELIQELIVDGRLPHLKALIDGGAAGTVQTIQPTISPLLWTTVATGVSPDRHGVIDFFEPERKVPVTSTSRRAPALWEISEAFARSAVVVNWWTALPPPDNVTAVYGSPARSEPSSPGTVPDELLKRALVPIDTVGHAQISRFMNIDGASFAQASQEGPVRALREVLARTWTNHRVGLELYRAHRPELFMLHFEGPDIVNHLFGPYHPPLREGVSVEGYRRYWATVSAYYAELDRLIGEWTRVLPEDTSPMLVSSHGMEWGAERPKAPPAGTSALSAHRAQGFFVAFGNEVQKSPGRQSLSIFDIAPTALALLGLPPSEEMNGTLIQSVFPEVTAVTGVHIVSYRDLMTAKTRPVGGAVNPEMYVAELKEIGHLADPSRVVMPMMPAGAAPAEMLSPQEWGLYAWHNNQGVQLARQKKLDEAVAEFVSAIRMNPSRPIAYLNLSIVLFDLRQYTESEKQFMQAIVRGLPNAEQYFVDYATLYRERDMVTRAVNLLREGQKLFPESYLMAANIGAALAASDRMTEALPELERALELRPTSTVVLNNLGFYWLQRKDPGRALDYWNRSLVIDPRQSTIREAVAAAQASL